VGHEAFMLITIIIDPASCTKNVNIH